MSVMGPTLSNEDFAGLTFGDKLSLSKVLFRSYGLTILGLMVISGLVLGLFAWFSFNWLGVTTELLVDISNGTVVLESISGLLMGVLCLFMAIALITQFIFIGLNTLILTYIDSEGPASVTRVFLAPWARFGTIFVCLLFWLGVYFLVQLVLEVLGQIPVLGLVIKLGLSVAYSIVINCATFYIADKVVCQNQTLAPSEAVARPVSIVLNNYGSWLATFGFVFAVYLPLIAVCVLGIYLKFPVLIIFGALVLMLASVYITFLYGVTYKQTLASYIVGKVESPFH